MKKFAIIVAGGVGTRMQSATPKQFLLLHNEPVIVKTIRQFLDFDPSMEIVVVLPENHLSSWSVLSESFPYISKATTVIGGATRSESVKAGLDAIPNKGLVAIHDAVRPFVKVETIQESFESADKFGSGVAAVPLKDSIREISSDKISQGRNRDNYMLVQTPQTFRIEEIKKAYDVAGTTSFSDDATVYEMAGFDVRLIEGNYSNIKITTPEDLP
jgi:2-C-methyl-D-erythritol 4-phosphate cytidylyltransferase